MDLNNNSSSPEFQIGDMVKHLDWGIGTITDIEQSTQNAIAVDFPNKLGHRISMDIAHRSLSILPVDGFEATRRKYPDKIKKFCIENPLKLIAMVLLDEHGKAKLSVIKSRLDHPEIITIKWPAWWKRVQQLIINSKQIKKEKDGFVYLLSTINEIEVVALPPTMKKEKSKKPEYSEISNIISKLASSPIYFEELNKPTLEMVAKELVKSMNTSTSSKDLLEKSLLKSVKVANVTLQELMNSKLMEQNIYWLKKYLLGLIETLEDATQKEESILAKTNLLKKTTHEFIIKQKELIQQKDLMKLLNLMLTLGLKIGISDVNWRLESLKYISKSIIDLMQYQPNSFQLIGKQLVEIENDNNPKKLFIKILVSQVEPTRYEEARNNILISLLDGSTTLAHDCLYLLIPTDKRMDWISWALNKLESNYNRQPFKTLNYLLTLSIPVKDPSKFLELVTKLSIYSQEIQSELGNNVSTILKEYFNSINSQTKLAIEKTNIPNLFLSNFMELLDINEQSYKEIKLSLEKEIDKNKSELYKVQMDNENKIKLISELRSGYRQPEKWAIFEGKKEILDSIALLYQDIHLALYNGLVQDSSIKWLLNELEEIMKHKGITIIGNSGNIEQYNNSFHKYITNPLGDMRLVKIVSPRLDWHNPSGETIVLAKSKVVGV